MTTTNHMSLMNSNQSEATTPNEKHIVPVLDLQQQMNALRDWAASSLTSIQERNHLSAEEKGEVRNVIKKHLQLITKSIKSAMAVPDEWVMMALLSEWEHYIYRQKHLNDVARYYELPVFTDIPASLVERSSSPLEVPYYVISEQLMSYLLPGDLLITTLLPCHHWPAAGELVHVQYRLDQRIPRRSITGWLKQVDDDLLTLEYQHPLLLEKIPDYSIPLEQVVNVLKVNTLQRDIK